ncbi:MAG: YihY/virulence factor BrkB family protein [Isosphaeraceae bacterium]
MFPPLRLKAALSLGGLSTRELLMRTWNKVNEHEIMTRAAAVSFYAMLALVPFLALILTITVQLLPDITGQSDRSTGLGNMTTAELRDTLKVTFPNEAYLVVEDQIKRLQEQKRPSLIWLLSGFAVTIWLASSLFVAVIDAMNRIYGVNESRSFVKIRLTAIAMTCIQAIILVGSLLVIVLWPQIVQSLGMSEPAALIATLVQWTVILFVVLSSFALTFFVGPDAEQHWEWITPGSVIGSLIFLAASFGFRLYVQHFADYDKTYGSLGGVMVLLFWFWISSLVVLTSAQINMIVEEASPLGKNFGQKLDSSIPLDLQAIPPEVSTPPPSRTEGQSEARPSITS